MWELGRRSYDSTMEITNNLISLFDDIERRAENFALGGGMHPFEWHANISGLQSPLILACHSNGCMPILVVCKAQL